MPFDFSTRRYISPVEQSGTEAILVPTTIPPSVVNQIIYPPEEYDGFNEVTVSRVDYTIDPNITISNIVEGVNILGITGIATSSTSVARYKIDSDGNAVLNDGDVTGKFDDIVTIKNNGLNSMFMNLPITGDVCLPHCNFVGGHGLYYAFYNTKINSFSMPNFVNGGHGNGFNSVNSGWFSYAFANSSITYLNMCNFINNANWSSIDRYCFGFCDNMCKNCKNLVEINFANMVYPRAGMFSEAFRNTGLINVNFPSLTRTAGPGSYPHQGTRSGTFNWAFADTPLESFSAPVFSNMDSGTFNGAFYNCRNFIDFNLALKNEMIEISGGDTFQNAFVNTKINNFCFKCNWYSPSSNTFRNAFRFCNELTEYSLFANKKNYDWGENYGWCDACYNCFNLLSFIIDLNRSGEQRVNDTRNYTFMNACRNCYNLQYAYISNNWNAAGNYSFQNSFANCYNLTSFDLSFLLKSYNNSFENAFYNCYNLTNVNLDNLSEANTSSFQYAFYGTNITDMDFKSLFTINGSNIFSHAFDSSNIKNLSFSQLTNTALGTYTSQFSHMLNNTNDCVVHFPRNLEPIMNTWPDVLSGFNGMNTTILFDLGSYINMSSLFPLTESGTIGGDTFAVQTVTNNENAYLIFDNKSTTGVRTTGNMIWYYPYGMRLYFVNLHCNVSSSSSYISYPSVAVSNDGENWTTVNTTYSNWWSSAGYSACPITFTDNDPNYYKYYKFITSTTGTKVINYVDVSGFAKAE